MRLWLLLVNMIADHDYDKKNVNLHIIFLFHVSAAIACVWFSECQFLKWTSSWLFHALCAKFRLHAKVHSSKASFSLYCNKIDNFLFLVAYIIKLFAVVFFLYFFFVVPVLLIEPERKKKTLATVTGNQRDAKTNQ